MNEIKMYIRNEEKIYVHINEEIILFENLTIEEIIENIVENYEIEIKNIGIILNFSYFLFMSDIKKYNFNILKMMYKYYENKFYLNYIENKYINLYIEKKIIQKIKGDLKKLKIKLSFIKIDFSCLYNFYKSKNKDIEILQLGDNESIRLLITNNQIEEFEKLDLKLEDVNNIEEFDFGNMEVILLNEENINKIFEGEKLDEGLNFNIKSEKVIKNDINLKKIGIKELFLILILIGVYFYSHKIIPIENEKNEIQKLQEEIKIKEKEYLTKKEEKKEDFTEELKILENISNNLKRKEYYSIIKFLIENNIYGIDYTKIFFENKKWLIQGEIKDFKLFEKFEKNLEKKYKNIELGYIKDKELESIFEYYIIESE